MAHAFAFRDSYASMSEMSATGLALGLLAQFVGGSDPWRQRERGELTYISDGANNDLLAS